MIAADTNVLVRLLTGDEPEQAAIAQSLFTAGPVWIAKTVLLETSWVLRSIYGFEDSAINDVFVKLLGLRNVHVEDKSLVADALDLVAAGVEFADALHFTSRPQGAKFFSFDRAFIRNAKRAGVTDLFGVSGKS
jgi:predicted nucleic-acid-binding protein